MAIVSHGQAESKVVTVNSLGFEHAPRKNKMDMMDNWFLTISNLLQRGGLHDIALPNFNFKIV